MKIARKILFPILSLVWGQPMTLIGALAALVLMIRGHRPKKFCELICFEVGHGWGGINFGPFFVVSKDAGEATKRHEAGHGLQNIILGPLMPILVGIPSLTRSRYRKRLILTGRKTRAQLPPYDSIWFEGWATKLGDKYFNSEVQR